MTKVASNANEKGGSPATTTSANPSQSNTSKTDQGEVPVITTNRCVQKRRRGVARDPIKLETLKDIEDDEQRNEDHEQGNENNEWKTRNHKRKFQAAVKDYAGSEDNEWGCDTC